MPTRNVLTGVSLIDLPWTNVWILHEGNKAMVIDTGTRLDRRAVLDGLHRTLPRGFELTNVLLTHGHCDHAGNAAYLCQEFGAKLVAGKDEEPFIANRRTYVPRGFRALSPKGLMFALGDLVFPVKRRNVDVCVRDAEIILSPIGPLKVINTPGHTAGHVSYFHEGRRILFSGDALLTVIPFLIKSGLSIAPSIFSVDRRAAIASLRRLAELEPNVILAVPGWPWLDETARAFHRNADSVRYVS